MTNPTGDRPIGLTRAEEAAEQKQTTPRIVVKAPPGVPTCRIPTQNGDDCPAAATKVIVWLVDGQKTLACTECANDMARRAKSHNTPTRIDPLG